MIAVKRSPVAERRPWRLRIPAIVRVVIVGGEPLDQRDRVLVGADRGLRLGQRHGELGERAAAPAKCDSRTPLFAVDVEDHFFDQAAQQLLAVAVGGGRRRPHSPEVGAECQQLLAFLGR